MSRPFVTRKGLAEHVKDKLGIPLTVSRINKLAMKRKGPPKAGNYGPTELYDPDVGLDWAKQTFLIIADDERAAKDES